MKLQAKFGIMTAVLVAAMFLSSLIAQFRISESNNLSKMVMERRLPVHSSMHDLNGLIQASVRDLESYMLFGVDPDLATRFIREREDCMARAEVGIVRVRENVARIQLEPQDSERMRKVDAGLVSIKDLEERIQRLNQAHTEAGTTEAYDLLRNELLGLNTSVAEDLDALMKTQRTLVDEESQKLEQQGQTVVFTLWITTLLGLLFGGGVCMVFTRHVSRGICRIVDHANAIAAGDLASSEGGEVSGDEIGELTLAMRKMQTSLSGIIGTVVNTARTLTGNADSMRSASDLIHRRIDEQSQQTQQAATALQQMSASIAEVSRHAQSAADTARSAAQTAHEGGDIVKEMLASMSSIATAVSETSSTVGLLGEDSKRISQIVTVIDEIARKTNLLALNAAIEAARAGEQGRGFAVVAGEVRRLAESTAEATSQISGMIRGIQERTHIAIASMASGTVTVSQGVVTTNQAGEALERIIGMAERVDRMIAQIAIAATQQSVAANQSSASLHSIYSLSHENLCEMATTASGIESLRSTAMTLEQHVVRFHLVEGKAVDVTPRERRQKPTVTRQPVLSA